MFGEFTVDLPMEVFTRIPKDIISWTGQILAMSLVKRTPKTQLFCKIIDFRKAKYLLVHKNGH